MSKYLCAFSSDFRPLYTADIYKVLAMPVGAVIHFRYKEKYIEEKIYQNYKNYENREVLVFFNHHTNNKNISVRTAKLVKAEIANNTGLFHAYMQLGHFKKCSIDDSNASDFLPPNVFFSELNCKSNASMWKDRVDAISPYLTDISFFNIKSITDINSRKIKPKLRRNQSYYYVLNHGKKYIINLAIANPSESNCKIHMNSSADDVSINITNPFEISANYDDISIPIYIKSLDVSKELSYISFSPQNKALFSNEYALNIEIEKRIGILKPILFGLFSLLLASAVLMAGNAVSSSGIVKNFWLLGTALLLLFIATSFLYFLFNKK